MGGANKPGDIEHAAHALVHEYGQLSVAQLLG